MIVYPSISIVENANIETLTPNLSMMIPPKKGRTIFGIEYIEYSILNSMLFRPISYWIVDCNAMGLSKA